MDLNPCKLNSPGSGSWLEDACEPYADVREAPNADNDRAFKLIRVLDGRVSIDTMIYRQAISDLQPLLICSSIDFPMPPSVTFCEQMWGSGYQVIFVRRPGFGTTPALPGAILSKDAITSGGASMLEAALITQLITKLNVSDIVLLTMGSSNALGYRLVKVCANISLAVFANPVFNQEVWSVFRPDWFQAILRQAAINTSGFSILRQAIRLKLREDPMEFYRQLLQKSRGDLDYLAGNATDCAEAARLIQAIDTKTMFYDFLMAMHEDKMLVDGYFHAVPVVAFSGEETTQAWKTGLNREAQRLGVPVAYAPRGDVFSPYASPDFLVETIRTCS